MNGTSRVLRGNALALPLADDSVDLVVTSPPYFGLRSYQDGGKHYTGQIGDETSPAEFIEALIAATREMVRVVKPSGSIWVNLGDKYSQPGKGERNMQGVGGSIVHKVGRAQPNRSAVGLTYGAPAKSLIGIPWRYALRCIDDLGLILRAEVIWSKPNGLPESVTDRTRRSHEQWFHFTKQPRYYSAVDEIREPHIHKANGAVFGGQKAVQSADLIGGSARRQGNNTYDTLNPLGKLPGSVWEISTEPLKVPAELGIDHFAAFPMEWPRRIIRGWAPTHGVCTVCGEGRRPEVATVALDMSRPQARRAHALTEQAGLTEAHLRALLSVGISDTGRGAATQTGTGNNTDEVYELADVARAALGGYAREYLLRRPTSFTYVCACPEPNAPTRPAVVVDPFGGTGTTALVAKVLGCDGISVDMSADYCRLAAWRTNDPGEIARAMQVKKPTKQAEGQTSLFDLATDGAA